MRASLFPATLVALATLICLSSSNMAQEGARPPAGAVPKAAAPAPNGTNVAVIDVAYIFKNHIRFNSSMKQLQQELEEFQAWMKTRESEFLALRETLKQYKAGTPEYQRHEEKMANEATQFQLESHRRKQDMAHKEAGLYHDTYAEMERTVALVAQRNRIGLVLRFTRETIKREEPNSVMQGINRAVVYHYGLDITKFILDELNAGQAAPAPTAGNGGNPGTRSATKGQPSTKRG